MAVNITWSLEENGSGLTEIDHGAASNGSASDPVQIFLRHDSPNELTGCGFYIAYKNSEYSGAMDPATDFTELISWGDAITENTFGGFQINMDHEGAFASDDDWEMSESQKTSLDGTKYTFRTGVGDSITNAITLSEKMSPSMSSDGVIPAGVTDVSFQCRIKIPSEEDIAGVREFDQYLKYSFTS